MIQENYKNFLRLYYRPRAAVSGILDHGTWLFSIAIVLAVVAMRGVGPLPPVYGMGFEEVETVEDAALPDASRDFRLLPDGLLAIPALALLYVPALIFLVNQIDGRRSFGFVLRREYGGLLVCAFVAWAAAHLPFALARLGLSFLDSPHTGSLPLVLLPKVYFGVFMALALNVVFGFSLGMGFLTAALAWLSFLLTPVFLYLTSPFLLYYLYGYFVGDLHAITAAFRTRQSFKHYLEICALNPSDAEAHLQLGLIHLERRQHAEAMARFEKALEIRPDEIEAHFHLGRVLRREGRLADAIPHFDAVLRLDPKFGRYEAWRERGLALEAAGRLDEARESLARFVAERPYDPEGRFALAEMFVKLTQTDRAREELQACIEAVQSMPFYRQGETRYWGRMARKSLARLG